MMDNFFEFYPFEICRLSSAGWISMLRFAVRTDRSLLTLWRCCVLICTRTLPNSRAWWWRWDTMLLTRLSLTSRTRCGLWFIGWFSIWDLDILNWIAVYILHLLWYVDSISCPRLAIERLVPPPPLTPLFLPSLSLPLPSSFPPSPLF